MNTRHLRPQDLAGKRWRGLVRESTERQADKWSPERQRSDLRRAADELGMVPADDPLFYERTGSGEAERAPELTAAIEDARRGEYDVLTVLHTSRFARNRAEAVTRKREFAKAGVVIYFAAQRIVSGTREGQLLEGMNEVIDEHANDERRFWIAGGIRERQFAGKWAGRIPFGYRRRLVDTVLPDGQETRAWDGTLEADPDNAAIIRRIFAEVLAGTPTRDLAGVLGPGWQRRTITQIVQNPVYIGSLIRYRRSYPHHYYAEADPHDGRRDLGSIIPALIDRISFEQANRLLSERATSSGVGAVRRAFPLSGVLRCADCGRKLTGGHGRGRKLRYYRCVGRTDQGDCRAPYARADAVEGQFAAWVGSFRLPPDWRQAIAKLAVSDARTDDASRQRHIQGQLTRIKNLYLLGDLALEDYQARSGELKQQLASSVPPSIANMGRVVDALADLGAAWANDADPRRGAIPTLLLTSAIVKDGRVVEWDVRAELRPLLELCLPAPDVAVGARAYSTTPDYIVRFTA